MKQHGFCLIEVLISLFILAIGLLSITKLQHVAMRSTFNHWQRSLAMSQVSNMAERLMMNNYLPVQTDDINHWQNENQLILNSKGNVSGSEGHFTIDLSWQSLVAGQKQITINL